MPTSSDNDVGPLHELRETWLAVAVSFANEFNTGTDSEAVRIRSDDLLKCQGALKWHLERQDPGTTDDDTRQALEMAASLDVRALVRGEAYAWNDFITVVADLDRERLDSIKRWVPRWRRWLAAFKPDRP